MGWKMDELIKLIKEHEGLRNFPYIDTVGKSTIGFGRNLTDVGISNDEAMFLLNNDINKAEIQLSHFTWFTQLDTIRQEVFIELCFNIGLTSLLKFTQTIQAIQIKDYNAAAMHLLNSKWASQVSKERSSNMAKRLKTGSYA
jgi:lysozyme